MTRGKNEMKPYHVSYAKIKRRKHNFKNYIDKRYDIKYEKIMRRMNKYISI
jgi:hypothetical protein